MAQRTARQWVINGVLIVVTLSFLGVSIAPLLGGILGSQQQQVPKATAQNTSEQDKIRIQIEGFEAVLKREPKNQTALEGLVNLRNQLGDIKGTLEPLQTLADSYPNIPEYRLILARTHLQLKDRESAVAEYRKVLTTKPGNLDALQILVSLELEDKRPEAAIGILQEAIKNADTANKIQPSSVDKPTIQWILGELYRKEKRYGEAIATYDRIAKENAKDFRPFVGKAQVNRAEGKEEEARKLFAEASKLAPAEFKDQINKLAAAPQQTEPFTSDTKQKTANPDPKPANTPAKEKN